MMRIVHCARSVSRKPNSFLRAFSSTPTPQRDSPTPVNVGDFNLTRSNKKAGKGFIGHKFESLIGDTLKEMEEDEEFKTTAANLKQFGQAKMTLEERKKRRRALDDMGVPSFDVFLQQNKVELKRNKPKILQLNIGLYCNQACNHCHVESSPKRTESMSMEVANRCLELLDKTEGIETLDLTGGAPELNPTFHYLVKEGRKRGLEVIDRCNLTVLCEPGQENLAEFLAENQVRVVASLPCYTAKNVNTQRGTGVFDRSIEGLQKLNSLGYGVEGSGLHMDLVYNPAGAFLPPAQGELEDQYRVQLKQDFGIEFDNLFTITNMPIKRFADFLFRRGELTDYMELLVRNFNPAAVGGVMCKETISVGWDGSLYDCDFNQQMALPLGESLQELTEEGKETKKSGVAVPKKGLNVFQADSLDFSALDIAVDHHCFGCTAGAGSSCQGTTE